MKNIILLGISVIFFFGCSQTASPKSEPVFAKSIRYSPLASKLIDEYRLSEADLLGLQFYISDDIILHKQSSSVDAEVKDGSLIINENNKLNQIIIKSKTPCVVIQSNKDSIEVEFDNNYRLTFMTSNEACCENKGLYYLSANQWNNGIGLLSVNGTTYQVIGGSYSSYLMLDKKFLDNNNPNLIFLDGKLINKNI